ncbi:phage major capsid protein [Enterococcus wangshanyuanii]|uniref:Phage capsid-like C-terminal domain-containing protein n=1 Tax=Enterococcus wangshanyuanii TaxID=2005703 RepID=A0ABQ1NSM8_9ENTE|nr:phage major capsid protein [Enterococcus wangshanyuanii]GGC84303.1 hypothetical protein GCM10011573_12400 [Enterococcus wangshanyuanii]
MTLLNLDVIKGELEKQRAAWYDAMKNGTEEEQKAAFNDFAEGMQNSFAEKAEALIEEINEAALDEKALVDRGLMKPMTAKERTFFNKAVEKQSFDGLDEVFPETIVEDIFSRLTEEHPIISLVDAHQTGALMKYVYIDPTKQTAFWGRVPDDIKQILLDSIKTINFETSKLSGYVVMVKGFFKLGPAWLAQYVTTVMYEIMAASLEIAIVRGNGKDQPIGLTMKLSGAVDGVYPKKDRLKLNDLKPLSLAGVRAKFAEEKTDIGEMSALVHPVTYWTKLFPNLAYQTDEGKWVLTNLPTGEKIIKSYAVEEDEMTVGVLKNYLLAVSGNTELKKYEETLAIEDLDLFVTKFYGTGLAKHQNAFFVYDLSDMQGATMATGDGPIDVKRPGHLLEPTPEETNEEVEKP